MRSAAFSLNRVLTDADLMRRICPLLVFKSRSEVAMQLFEYCVCCRIASCKIIKEFVNCIQRMGKDRQMNASVQ